MKKGLLFIAICCTGVSFGQFVSGYVYYFTKVRDLELKKDRTKTAVVTYNNNVLVAAYNEEFIEKFATTRNFVSNYITLYMRTLQEQRVFAQVKSDASLGLDSVNPFKETPPDIADSVLGKIAADYLINFYGFEIAVGTDYHSGSSSEYCIVKARCQIYDVKARQKVQDLWITGNGTAFFGTHAQALSTAFENSVNHSVKYLIKGK